MRLPAITVKQQQNEDARQLHERLYAAYLSHEDVWLAAADGQPAAVIKTLNDGLQRFWRERGFWLRFKTAPDRAMVRCWLELRTTMRKIA